LVDSAKMTEETIDLRKCEIVVPFNEDFKCPICLSLVSTPFD